MTTYEKPTDLHRLQGKAVLLTGCSTGIGRATAEVLHSECTSCGRAYRIEKNVVTKVHIEHGANLALVDWNENAALELIADLGGSRE